MGKKVNVQYHMWTKDDIKTAINLWDSMTTEELADNIGVSKTQLMYMVSKIRKAGHNLPRKSVKGKLDTLIRESLMELKLIRR